MSSIRDPFEKRAQWSGNPFLAWRLRTQSKRFPFAEQGNMIETIDGGLEFVYLLPFAVTTPWLSLPDFLLDLCQSRN